MKKFIALVVSIFAVLVSVSCKQPVSEPAIESSSFVKEEIKPEPPETLLETVTWMMKHQTCRGSSSNQLSEARQTSLSIQIDRIITAQGGTKAEQEAFVWLICKESQFRNTAKSPVGAMGLTQMMPATAAEAAKRFGIGALGPEDLYDPEISLSLGYRHFLFLSSQLNGNLARISASYNGGMGGATMKAFKSGGLGAHETDNYVASLFNTMEELRIHKQAKVSQ